MKLTQDATGLFDIAADRGARDAGLEDGGDLGCGYVDDVGKSRRKSWRLMKWAKSHEDCQKIYPLDITKTRTGLCCRV